MQAIQHVGGMSQIQGCTQDPTCAFSQSSSNFSPLNSGWGASAKKAVKGKRSGQNGGRGGRGESEHVG